MRFNILIDINSILYRIANSLANKGNKLNNINDGEQFKKVTLTKIVESIKFSNVKPHRVIICQDSRLNWRSKIPSVIIAYKSNRKKSEPRFNKDNFRKFSQELMSELSKEEIFCVQKEWYEADDLIFLLSNHFLKLGESSIIVSSDSDLHQLMKSNGNAEVFIMDHMKSCFVTSNKTESAMDIDFFASGIQMPYTSKQRTTVDPDRAILVKMLSSDKSDDVPAALFYKKYKKEDSKEVSLTKGVAEKYFTKNKSFDPIRLLDTEFRIKFCKDMVDFLNVDIGTVKMEGFVRDLKVNMYFTLLHEKILPKQLIDDMAKVYQRLENEEEISKHKAAIEKYFNIDTDSQELSETVGFF